MIFWGLKTLKFILGRNTDCSSFYSIGAREHLTEIVKMTNIVSENECVELEQGKIQTNEFH